METGIEITESDVSSQILGDVDFSRTIKVKAIEQHLSSLRRYARALSGSLEIADSYIAWTLQQFAEEGLTDFNEVDAKVALFAAFTDVWRTHRADLDDVKRETKIGEMLEDISNAPRQAFLLSAAEGFSNEEIGRILKVDSEAVADLLETASFELPK